jgi:hypothetical protein
MEVASGRGCLLWRHLSALTLFEKSLVPSCHSISGTKPGFLAPKFAGASAEVEDGVGLVTVGKRVGVEAVAEG